MNSVADRTCYGLGLCAGAAGLELGLEIGLPGYRTVCLVEREAPVVGRLAARMREGSFDEAPVWDDVTTFDGRDLAVQEKLKHVGHALVCIRPDAVDAWNQALILSEDVR